MLISRARKSNAAYKEDLRKAAKEEKERLATREREKEEAGRKRQLRSTLRSGPGKIFRRRLRRRRSLLRNRTMYRRQLWQKVIG